MRRADAAAESGITMPTDTMEAALIAPDRSAIASRHDSHRPARPRARVLLSACAVSPIAGSENAAGWNLALRLAQYHDVTVLCSSGVEDDHHCRREIGQYLQEHGQVPGLTFHFVDPPWLSLLLQREGGGILRRRFYYTGYAAWQRAALQQATELHRRTPFDLAHHLNISSYREPGYLWRLGIPFLWGPVGGALNMPLAFFSLLGWRDRLFYGLRNASNAMQMRLRRRCIAAARAAQYIWATTEENRQMIQRLWHRPCQLMLDSGTQARPEAAQRDYDGRRPLRLVWSGMHIGRKAMPILLHALARLHRASTQMPPMELTVLGSGPETERWKALARQLHLPTPIHWKGRLPHAEALAEVSCGDVFVFTSVQEGAPHVVPEALSLGLPVICHHACGMGVAVTDACGIRVPMVDPSTSIEGFANAVERLLRDPCEVRRLSDGALSRAAELSWDNKAKQIADAYDAVIAERRGADLMKGQ
jgi:glycosyltransferase involved in cell wall biosynthesis